MLKRLGGHLIFNNIPTYQIESFSKVNESDIQMHILFIAFFLQLSCRENHISSRPKSTLVLGIYSFSQFLQARKVNCGLLSLRQAVVVHWNAKIPPTNENDPWRPSFRQTELKPVTVAFRVASSRTIELRTVSSVLFFNLRVVKIVEQNEIKKEVAKHWF